MRATLEFNLPEEHPELQHALKAGAQIRVVLTRQVLA